jgi:hypothetical protein
MAQKHLSELLLAAPEIQPRVPRRTLSPYAAQAFPTPLWGRGSPPSRYAPEADGRFTSGAAPTEFSVVICFSPLVGLPDSLVRKDQREVCPLSRGVISPKAQLLSIPLRNGIRFFPHPLPAPLSTHLTAYLPSGSDTGLSCSACLPKWVRSSLSAGDRLSTTGKA